MSFGKLERGVCVEIPHDRMDRGVAGFSWTFRRKLKKLSLIYNVSSVIL